MSIIGGKLLYKKQWILYVAGRFLKAKRRKGGVTPSLFSILGLAVGVLTLISVLSVMNGFQLGFIEDILEIGSYHIRVYPPSGSDGASIIRDIRKAERVRSAVPFIDVQTMLEGPFSGTRGCNVRGIDPAVPLLDDTWAEQMQLDDALSNNEDREAIAPGTVWLGSVLAENLGLIPGDKVSFLSMAGNSFSGLRPAKSEFTVGLIFSSGYYEYDSAMAFIRLDEIGEISSGKEKLHIGIKLNNRWRDRQFIQMAEQNNLLPEDAEIVSWRSYNRSFFGALRMEKLAMMMIIGIVFLVVGVNIKHSLERSVWEKREAIGLLRSVGARPVDIRSIFLIDGALIGTIGGGCGIALGLLIAGNINALFRAAEDLVNGIMHIAAFLLRPFFSLDEAAFSLFSSTYFYLQEVPSRVMYREVLMVFLFSLAASLLAAWGASKAISDFDPAEILRYE
jgi:lipoprotein-releasing system permease protein